MDPWFPLIQAVEEFNANRKKIVAASLWKVFDEQMSAWCPQTTKTGGLLNISFVERKPEPLGTNFKCVCCAITGLLLGLEIQRGKFNEVPLWYDDLNTTTAVSARLADLSARSGQDQPSDDNVNPGVIYSKVTLGFHWCLQWRKLLSWDIGTRGL